MNLFTRFVRAIKKFAGTDQAPTFTARAHCSACGKSRWGAMRLSATRNGAAAFRCDVAGHMTIYVVQKGGTFRHLSRGEHLALREVVGKRAAKEVQAA